MFANFKGKIEKMPAVKLYQDGNEIPFRYELYEDENIEVAPFLSNLQMTDSTIIISTGTNLNWNVKDVVLLGSERNRYQVNSVRKVKRNIPKNFMCSRIKYDYILVISS